MILTLLFYVLYVIHCCYFYTEYEKSELSQNDKPAIDLSCSELSSSTESNNPLIPETKDDHPTSSKKEQSSNGVLNGDINNQQNKHDLKYDQQVNTKINTKFSAKDKPYNIKIFKKEHPVEYKNWLRERHRRAESKKFKYACTFHIPNTYKNFTHSRFIELINHMTTFTFDNFILNNDLKSKKDLETFTNLITNIFCIKKENEVKYRLRKEFVIMQFFVPELLPFIYFINNSKIYEKNIITQNDVFYLTFIKIYNDVIETYKNITKVLSDNKDKTTLFNNFTYNSKNKYKKYFAVHLIRFRRIIADLIKLFYKDEDLFLTYDLLARTGEYKITKMHLYGYALEEIFFIYFVVIFDTKNNKFFNNLTKCIREYHENFAIDKSKRKNNNRVNKSYKSILYTFRTYILTVIELNDWYSNFIECISFFNYTNVLDLSCLNGFVGFVETNSLSTYMLYDCVYNGNKRKYLKKIEIAKFVELCHLQLQGAIFYN